MLANIIWHFTVRDLLAQLIGDRGVVFAKLAADRLKLLAQHVLALLGGCAFFNVIADPLANLQLGEPLALHLKRQLQPFAHVGCLKQLDLLVEGQVGGVAGGVGERARFDDCAHP